MSFLYDNNQKPANVAELLKNLEFATDIETAREELRYIFAASISSNMWAEFPEDRRASLAFSYHVVDDLLYHLQQLNK